MFNPFRGCWGDGEASCHGFYPRLLLLKPSRLLSKPITYKLSNGFELHYERSLRSETLRQRALNGPKLLNGLKLIVQPLLGLWGRSGGLLPRVLPAVIDVEAPWASGRADSLVSVQRVSRVRDAETTGS